MFWRAYQSSFKYTVLNTVQGKLNTKMTCDGGATISLFSHLERAMPTIFSVGKFPVEACDFLVPKFFLLFCANRQ